MSAFITIGAVYIDPSQVTAVECAGDMNVTRVWLSGGGSVLVPGTTDVVIRRIAAGRAQEETP